MPHRNMLKPTCCSPETKPGPALMPTIAMKTLRPSVFMSHSDGAGMLPNVGWMVRR